jgi:hypothetical protein
MSSETSTESRTDAPGGLQATHFYLIASMVAATAAVMVSRNTHPVALLLISAAAISAGMVGLALYYSVSGFFGLGAKTVEPPSERLLENLTREKALVLRSIKELEFDKAMGKVSDADFADIGGRLRTRALSLMQEIDRAERTPAPPAPRPTAPRSRRSCADCGRTNDADAHFCKQCGARL